MQIPLRQRWQRCSAAVTIAAICSLSATAATGAPAAEPAPRLGVTNATAADEASRSFRKLRNLRGHFSGAGWNPAVDAWGGELHHAMQTLGAWAAQQELQPPALLALMGEPDERRDCAAGSCEPLLRSLVWPDDHARATGLGATELWIYNWRRGRDRLVLALRGQQVTAAGWRYLGE